MKKKLLLKFADFLEQQIKISEFDFSTVIGKFEYEDDETPICCTVGCAIGWLPAFHKTRRTATKLEWRRRYKYRLLLSDDALFVFDGEPMDYVDLATSYFNFDIAVWPMRGEAKLLFSPYGQGDIKGWGDFPVCNGNATPKDVANAIRHYVEIRS